MSSRLSLFALVTVAACSGGSNGSLARDGGTAASVGPSESLPAQAADAGSDAGRKVDGGPLVTMSGEIYDRATGFPLEGAQVSLSMTQVVKTAADGRYSFDVAKDAPIWMTVFKMGYVDLDAEVVKLHSDQDRGRISMMSSDALDVLLSGLHDNPSKGALVVSLVPLSTCTPADFPEGATITVPNQPNAKVVYMRGTPDVSLTSAQAGQSPTAVIVGLEPRGRRPISGGYTLKVETQYGSCRRAAFPVHRGDLTYYDEDELLISSNSGPTSASLFSVFFE